MVIKALNGNLTLDIGAHSIGLILDPPTSSLGEIV
jgi:hypothetical protein